MLCYMFALGIKLYANIIRNFILPGVNLALLRDYANTNSRLPSPPVLLLIRIYSYNIKHLLYDKSTNDNEAIEERLLGQIIVMSVFLINCLFFLHSFIPMI